ncbi:MAG TPA: NAD(P)-dependent oxidoreductase [bacterium]|nr:NAD(P)-dependent oxidoreductase [bacterium]HOL47264.1 NAD(P)-dependent oxidoreductase [bacterium]HPQ19629.1 NAD(P)-dependent oxidoreductase [bacterium]
MKKIKIGITGSTGFIGQHLVNYLEKSGYIIDTFEEHKFNFFHQYDIEQFIKDKDVIIHLAAVIIGNNEEMNFNISSTYNLLNAIAKLKTKKKVKFVYFSTTQVYGYSEKRIVYTEESKIKPVNYHSLTKFVCEQMVLNYENIVPIVLRLTNVYGIGARPNYNSALATFVYNIFNDLPITLNNFGKQKRNYIYVKDLCFIIDKILRLNFYGLLNICSDETISIKKLVEALYKLYGKKPLITYKTISETINNATISNIKLRKLIPNLKFTKLKEGLKEYVEEYRRSTDNKT